MCKTERVRGSKNELCIMINSLVDQRLRLPREVGGVRVVRESCSSGRDRKCLHWGSSSSSSSSVHNECRCVRACLACWLVGRLRAAGKGVTAPSHPLTRPTCFLGWHKKTGWGSKKAVYLTFWEHSAARLITLIPHIKNINVCSLAKRIKHTQSLHLHKYQELH